MNAFKRMVLVPEDQYKSCLLKTVPDYDSILKSSLPEQMKINLINKILYNKPAKQLDAESILKLPLPENIKLKIINQLAQSIQPDVKPSFFGEVVEEHVPKNDPEDYSYMAYNLPKKDNDLKQFFSKNITDKSSPSVGSQEYPFIPDYNRQKHGEKQAEEEQLLSPLQPARFVPKPEEKSTPVTEKRELFSSTSKDKHGSPKKALTYALREIENFISPNGAVYSKENADYIRGSDINAIITFLSKPSFADKAPNGTKEVLKRIILDKPQVIEYIKNPKYRQLAETEYKKTIEIKAKFQKPETPQTSSLGRWLNY